MEMKAIVGGGHELALEDLSPVGFVSNEFLHTVFAQESVADAATKARKISKSESIDDMALVRRYKSDGLRNLISLYDSYRPTISRNMFRDSKEHEDVLNRSLSYAFESGAEEILHSPKSWKHLPNELRRILDPLKEQYNNLETAVESMGDDADQVVKFKKSFQRDQLKTVITKAIFNNLARVHELINSGAMKRDGEMAYEGVMGTYQNAVYYPQFETVVQFAQTSGTFHTKVIKQKTLLNYATTIPIHTRQNKIVWQDANGKKIKEVKREELYYSIDPKDVYADAYQTNTRTLRVNAAEFKQYMDLYEDTYSSISGPFLKPREYVRSDFKVTNIKIGTLDYGKLYDYRAGRVLADTMSEIDRKGKIIPLNIDPNDPKAIYNVAINFDQNNYTLMVDATATKAGMTPIDYIELEFKMNDAELMYQPQVMFRSYDETVQINAGDPIIYHIPINTNEYALTSARMNGDYLNIVVNLCAEFYSNQKEYMFKNFYMEMLDELRSYVKGATDPRVKDQILYANAFVDLKNDQEIRKVENWNFRFAPHIDAIRDRLNYAGHTSYQTQMNMFTHMLNRQIFQPAMSVISGTVTQDTNGQFLGVEQDALVYCLTIGTDKSQVANSIVVLSAKADFLSARYDKNGTPFPIDEMAFKTWILPYFKEPNMETVMMTETPTRITNNADYRSRNNMAIPAMMMESTVGFAKLRPAAAELVVTGFHVDLLGA